MDDNPEPVRTEVILADRVPRDPVACPKCKGITYKLEGCTRRAFTTTVQDGIEVDETLGDDTFKDVEILICPACQTRFSISDELTYTLFQENQELRVQLAAAQGLAGMPVSGRPN